MRVGPEYAARIKCAGRASPRCAGLMRGGPTRIATPTEN